MRLGWSLGFLFLFPSAGVRLRAEVRDRLGDDETHSLSDYDSAEALGYFNAVNADDIVRRYDAWRGTEAARTYILGRCEDHGLD